FVYVELEDERITVSQCDCPFDGLCKHEVAAYFAIRQAFHTKPEVDFTALFNQFTQQELVALLADIVSKDPLLQKRFTLMKKKEAVTTEMLIGQTKATIAKLFMLIYAHKMSLH
ncbi:MAG TPA: SWIM zinc finger family protein, partial [Solibacillus sp.]